MINKETKSTQKLENQLQSELYLHPSILPTEIQFRELVEFSPDAIFIYSGETVVFANHAGAKLLGVNSKEEIIGKSLRTFIHPEFWHFVANRVWQLQNGESVPNAVEKFIRFDGKVIDVEVAAVPFMYRGRAACQVAVRDITLRKNLERELKKKAEFENMIASISTSFINQRPHKIEKLITLALKRVGEFLGVKQLFVVTFYPGTLKLADIFGWACEDYHIQREEHLNLSLKHNFPWFATKLQQLQKVLVCKLDDIPATAIDERAYLADKAFGSFAAVPLVYGSKLQGFVGLHTSKIASNSPGEIVTEVQMVADIIANALAHKRAAEELLLSEQCFNKAFNASSSLITIHSVSTGKFINVNEGFLKVTGYQSHEVINKRFNDLEIWLEPQFRRKLKQQLLKYTNLNNVEFRFRIKTGEERFGLISTEQINLNGLPHIMTIIIDITERKQLEREMAKLERLNLVGEMAAGIGHEIRNPLTSVRGFLQVLGAKEECVLYKDYFDLMIDELDRANAIITEFLSLAKNKPVVFQPKNLNLLITLIFPLIMADAMTINKSIRTELGVIPDLLVDEKEIRQLLLNLVRNGLEAMPAGGTLAIKTYAEANEVILAIKDEGQGIPLEMLTKLGTPFITTKENGTGLGLAVCYSIVARHKGTINVETGPDGTTFYIHFKQNIFN